MLVTIGVLLLQTVKNERNELYFKRGVLLLLFMKYCFYVCILGFFVQGFPKLLRFQEHHEKILNKFLSKLKQHLVGRCNIDLCPLTPRIKLEELSAAFGPNCFIDVLCCPFHLLYSYNS